MSLGDNIGIVGAGKSVTYEIPSAIHEGKQRMEIGMDPASKSDCSFFQWVPIKADENPIPEAQRCAAIVLCDPTIADRAEAYAKANGGRVSSFYGFKFVMTESPERVRWKRSLINRLNWERNRRDEAEAGAIMQKAALDLTNPLNAPQS